MASASNPEQRAWITRVLGISAPGEGAPAGGDPQASDANGAGPTLSPVKLGKSALLLRGFATKARKDIEALCSSILAAADADTDVTAADRAEIVGNLALVRRVSEELNLALADEIDNLMNTPVERRAAAIASVRSQLDACQSFFEGNEIVDLLAANEFHPVATKAESLKMLGVIRAVLSEA